MSDTTSTSPRWISCADTAKLVRKALKAEFPGTKFSVRSSNYAGGASISVRYTDGPTAEKVNAVCSLYQGSTFDGMIDLKTPHRSLLTTEDGAEEVRFAADFVNAQRNMSDEVRDQLIAELEAFTGETYDPSARLAVGVDTYQEADGSLCRDDHRGEWGSTILHQMFSCRTY